MQIQEESHVNEMKYIMGNFERAEESISVLIELRITVFNKVQVMERGGGVLEQVGLRINEVVIFRNGEVMEV